MFFCEYFTKLLRVSISENICGELLLENEDLETLEIEIKLNAHETFRKRLGRLLNVLCTFKLCLVSRKEFRKIWNYKYKYIEKPALSKMYCNKCITAYSKNLSSLSSTQSRKFGKRYSRFQIDFNLSRAFLSTE